MHTDITCPVCERPTPADFVERHHLVPRAKKGKETVSVCIDCGDMLHKLFTVKELAKVYNSVEKIKANPKVQNWAKWIQRRPFVYGITMRTKKRR